MLATRLAEVRTRIEQAAQRVGRNSSEITLVGVTKTVERDIIAQAYQAGLKDFGENRVVQMDAKFNPPPYPVGAARLHLIGHLQTNKAKRAVTLADVIHSVDSLKLAQSISHHAQELGKIMPILLEVNVSGEAAKAGLTPAELETTLEAFLLLPNLELQGLMTMAPFSDDPETTRPVFAGLRELLHSCNPGLASWRELSMGMTNDFEVAIEEGATIVRVGRAIFDESAGR
jgi:PLP dependent protein